MPRIFAAALLLALPAQLHAMPLELFLKKAAALEAKGALAMFSGDMKLLTREIQNAGKALRAEQAAAVARGSAPPFCLPKKANMDAKEILAFFRAIPAERRAGMQVREAFRSLVLRRYPCS